MKKILFLLIVVALFSSCASTYFYSTVNSLNDNTTKNEHGNFIFENDTVKIIYSFNGKDGPIHIDIQNKINEPLCVDWQRSAVIIKDIATSYVGQKIEISGSTESSTVKYSKTYSTSDGSFNGVAALPQNIGFIPPKSKIAYAPIKMTDTNFSFRRLSEDKQFEETLKNANMANKDGEATIVKVGNFSESNTPLMFRSYLTMYVGEDFKNKVVVDQNFYISNLIKTKGLSPTNMPHDLARRGDLFYYEKEANKTAGYVIGSLALAGGAIALVAATGVSPDNTGAGNE